MNYIDKMWYRTLRFLSRYSIDSALMLKKNNPKKYRKYVPDLLEETFEQYGYLATSVDSVMIVTQSGLQ